MAQKFKITYATMSADNEELQSAFDKAVDTVKSQWLGSRVPMFINGREVLSQNQYTTCSPVDTDMVICTGQAGTAAHAADAIEAAAAAKTLWADVPWQKRAGIIRKIAADISDNIFELSAAMVLEVGKNRLEALGEVQETVDLLEYYAASMEDHNGFINEMGKYNPDDPKEQNFSVLKPFGVWVVISPFNFPMALSAAPIAAALVAGNTVVFKGASDTPLLCWKTAELFARAGLPDGVFNYVSGSGKTVGQELLSHPKVDGWTFTGSFEVGMQVVKTAGSGAYPRPAIVEMGGKNPTIVSDSADIEKAAAGVMRSAFGLDGQKCSACSRVYVQKGVYDRFKARLVEMTRAIKIGDPTLRDTYMGTVINKTAYDKYKRCIDLARQDGTVLTGGSRLTEGVFAKGYYVEPAIIEGLSEDHELVRNELFLPILHLARVENLDEAMEKANDTPYGLTAGFFGEDRDEVTWFLKHIKAGTLYTNRAAGATTGAWPGIQVFGGWKGSGSSGKGIGGLYTLSLYLHEQSQTIIG